MLSRSGKLVLIEAGALDVEAHRLQPLDQCRDRLGIAGLAFDLDQRVLGRQTGKYPLVLHLDDVDSAFMKFRGNRRQSPWAILGVDAKSGDAAAADQLTDEDVGEQMRVDIAAT